MIFLKHQVSLQMAEKKSCATGKVWKESERKRIGVWRAPERERDGWAQGRPRDTKKPETESEIDMSAGE